MVAFLTDVLPVVMVDGSSQVLLRFGVIKDRAGLPRGTDQRECEAIEPEPAGVAPCQDEKDARDK